MLTREAWNALLKILEEPPPRVVFCFATTEPQKIQQAAAPILSRCQRFDFRRIGVSDISDRLSEVLEREGTKAPAEALRILGRKADGGMRDALSLMDQVLALGGEDITIESVRRVLGLVEDERYVELLGMLAEARHGEVFPFVQDLLDEGYDLVEFYHGLVDALRALLRLRLDPDAEIPELADHLHAAYRDAGAGWSPPDIVRMLSLASELESTGSLRRSGHPRLLVEMLLLRLSYLDRTVELEDLIRGLGGAPGEDPSPRAAVTTVRPTPEQVNPHDSGEEAVEEDATVDDGAVDPDAVDDAVADNSAVDKAGVEEAAEGDAAEGDAAEANAPADDLDSGAEPAGADGLPLDEAWQRTLESTELPSGLATLLRAGELSGPDEGRVLLRIDAAAAERLGEAGIGPALAANLGQLMGHELRLLVEAPAGDAERVTQQTVKEGRLREYIAEEPLLERAVLELDLELLD